MGGTNSKVCPQPLGVGVETLKRPKKKPARWNSLLRGLKNIGSRKNRVLPMRETSYVAAVTGYNGVDDVDSVDDIHNVAAVTGYDDVDHIHNVDNVDNIHDFDYDIDQPSTSYPRDETVNAHEFLLTQRLIAAEESYYDDLYADDEYDDEIYRQNDMHWRAILKSMSDSEKRCNQKNDVVTNGLQNQLEIANLRQQQGGVAFEVTPVVGEIKSSQRGPAFELTEGKRSNQLKAAVTSNRTTHEPAINNSQPISMAMQGFKVSRGGVTFDIVDEKSPNEIKAAPTTRPTARLSGPIARKNSVRKSKGGVAFVIDM